MNREPWVVYLVVIGVVALMLYGKYLMSGAEEDDLDSDKK
ncbi:hypothetical protein MNB_SV-14-853 [hydrothermal vent metagenome]|uniref:Uncharacterized protein n=1 Tax=hydrothermal vent metagenome TaxID=652676 RepID=A0A1W1BNX6_9ZZZZ